MSEFVTVDIPQGRLRGKRVTSATTGLSYCSFQRIPYAKPPVGPLRFKAPEEPDPWIGTRDATEEGPVAPQFDIITHKLVGNEDCLFLNVYTPQWPVKSTKPVMVWIHGGGLIFGSGNTDVYGPDFLVAEDVVLVTINYRLGLLGFLYMDGADMKSNNGIRDQVMALKWVRNNIAQFGGDAGNVTIFGESAGSCSVHFLTLTPLAAGLFHRAIMQSGTVSHPGCFGSPESSAAKTLNVARLLGCTSEDPQEVVHFLRAVPADQIVALLMETITEQEEKLSKSSSFFFLCDTSCPQALLPDAATTILEEGLFTKVPLMIGVTSAEGTLFQLMDSPKDRLLKLEKNFQVAIPVDLDPIRDTERTKKIADALRKFYFGDGPLRDDAIVKDIDMRGDLSFVYPMHRVVQLQMKWSPHPTFVYLFDHKNSDIGCTLLPVFGEEHPGAPHTAELPYLFQSSLKPNTFPSGSPEAEVQSGMVKLWTNFAKTGDPATKDENFSWIPTTQEKLNYLKINNGFQMETNMFQKRIEFLSNLYNEFGPPK